MAITEIKKCRECGSESLTWDTHSKTDSGVPEGRLRSHEVKCLFVLGCWPTEPEVNNGVRADRNTKF